MNRNIYNILKEAFIDVLNTEDDQHIDSNIVDVLKDSEDYTLQSIDKLLNKQYNARNDSIKYTIKSKRIGDALFLQTFSKYNNQFLDYKDKVRIQEAYKDDLQTFIDLAVSIGIKYFGFTVEYIITGCTNVHTLDVNYVVDFQGIEVLGLHMSHATIYNVVINDAWFNEPEFRSIPRKLSENTICQLTSSFIAQSSIENVQYVDLKYCDNLKDFSFIHNVNSRCEIHFIDKYSFPKSGNFTGLPDGQYKLWITFGADTYVTSYTDISDFNMDDRFNFIGIPDTITELDIMGKSIAYKNGILNNISFEGLSPKLVEKINRMEFYVGGDQTNVKIVMFGAKQLRLRQTKWKPNKKDLLKILNVKDYFLASYAEGEEAPTYIPPSNINDESYLAKQLKQNKAKQQKAEDDAEDLQKMIELLKKYLKRGDILYGYRRLDIKAIGSNYIQVGIYGFITGLKYKSYTFKSFINQMKQHNYRLNSKTGELFNDLIVKPVEQRRQRILNQRKKKEQEEKIAQKIQTRLEKEEKPKAVKKEKPIVKKEVSTPNNNDVNIGIPGIEVIDYSEKAYAIFGNTYQIKDDLKDIGASFNPRLNYKGGKKAGWIIGKRKKDKLEQILNN